MRWPLPWPKSWRTRGEPPSGPGREEDAEDREDDEEEQPRPLKESALLLLRDVVLAFVVVGVVMLLLLAYTRVWPPMVVVESGSMQHSGTESFVGVIDTGDLVLVQQVGTPGDITTYVEGRARGYESYSNYGDVIIFYSPDQILTDTLPDTPIIHRAIVYVVPNPAGGVDVPGLAGRGPLEWTGILLNGTPASAPYGLRSLTVQNVWSWGGGTGARLPFTYDMTSVNVSGFLTKGDHNGNVDLWQGRVQPVPLDRVIGKARGELPWFGLIKLTFARDGSGCCSGWGDPVAPRNSWDALLVSLILVIAGPFVADYGWAWYMGRRKAKRQAARRALEVAEPPPEPVEPPPEGSPPGPVGEAPPIGENAPADQKPEIRDEARTESVGPEGDAP